MHFPVGDAAPAVAINGVVDWQWPQETSGIAVVNGWRVGRSQCGQINVTFMIESTLCDEMSSRHHTGYCDSADTIAAINSPINVTITPAYSRPVAL